MPLILGLTAGWRMIWDHLTGELIFKGRTWDLYFIKDGMEPREENDFTRSTLHFKVTPFLKLYMLLAWNKLTPVGGLPIIGCYSYL